MNWCKLFGHKWESYHQKVRVDTHLILNAMINTEFRYCDKCSTNQMRVAYTGDDKCDWKDYELTVEQLRGKKLKELGI
jgi:hypothetical protein